MLGDAPGWGDDDSFSFMRASMLAQFEREWSLYSGAPNVFGTLGTAAGSMLSQGFVFHEDKRRLFPCRHSVRPWFKRGGLAIAWRIEF